VVLLRAAVSLQFGPCERTGVQSTPDKSSLGTLGGRPNTNSISIVSAGSDGGYWTTARDFSAVFGGETSARAAAAMKEAVPAVL
jgi:hypothetical protein